MKAVGGGLIGFALYPTIGWLVFPFVIGMYLVIVGVKR